eukprot:TRINITY_DN10299_c0_g1_i1.p3 TRINITY_DN10299_c0_g1~~TRINITY_DN10299_c0_g1_i1.p3  ORF type:complete len:137 (-),score=6.44 TRINITY_DN10299_c0_g1_i1:89-499(-)
MYVGILVWSQRQELLKMSYKDVRIIVNIAMYVECYGLAKEMLSTLRCMQNVMDQLKRCCITFVSRLGHVQWKMWRAILFQKWRNFILERRLMQYLLSEQKQIKGFSRDQCSLINPCLVDQQIMLIYIVFVLVLLIV